MFERILVPLDGSERAERALPLAARVARATGGSLLLVRVLSGPAELVPFVASVFEPSTLSIDLRGSEGYLAGLAATVSDVPTETAVRTGLAAPAIADYARSANADAIVLCSHGETGLASRVLGSTAERLGHSAPVPMFVLREQSNEQSRLLADPQPGQNTGVRVLLPLDDTATAEAAMLPAAALAAALSTPGHGALDLLRVLERPANKASDKDVEQAREDAEDYLRLMSERLRRDAGEDLKLPIAWLVAEAESAAEGVLDVARGTPGYDLVAIATSHADKKDHWPLGNVLERLLHHTQLPLLLVHPPDEAQ